MVSQGPVLDLILLESITCKSLKVCGEGLFCAMVSWRKCSGLLKPTLDLIRKVEESGKSITIRRRGRVVARLEPAGSASGLGKRWEDLRALGGMPTSRRMNPIGRIRISRLCGKSHSGGDLSNS